MVRKTKRLILASALFALFPVIPGAIANSAVTAEWSTYLNGPQSARPINLSYSAIASLLAPGIFLAVPIGLLLSGAGVENHFWFWLNIVQALVSWVFYFGVILLILSWRARRKSVKLASAGT